MSVSITNPDTIKGVSSLMAELTTRGDLPFELLELASASKGVIGALVDESVLPNDLNGRASMIARQLYKQNEKAFKSRYTNWEESYSEAYNEQAIDFDNLDDFKIPLNDQGVAYLVSALNSIQHGQEQPYTPSKLVYAMQKMERNAGALLLDLNHPPLDFTVSDVHDSIIKLSQNGDDIYGVSSGLRSVLGPLEYSDQNKTYYSDDILLHLLDTAMEEKPLVMPGVGRKRLSIETEGKRSTNQYRIASDVPEPTDQDIAIVSQAMRLVDDYLDKITKAEQPDGKEYPEINLSMLRKSVKHVLDVHTSWSQNPKKVFDGDLSFNDAVKKREAFTSPSIKLYVVGGVDDVHKGNIIEAANGSPNNVIFKSKDELDYFMAHQKSNYTPFNVVDGIISKLESQSNEMRYVRSTTAVEALIKEGFKQSIDDFGDYLGYGTGLNELHIKNIIKSVVSPYTKDIAPEAVEDAITKTINKSRVTDPDFLTNDFMMSVGVKNQESIKSLSKPEVERSYEPSPDIQNAPSIPPRRMN